MVETSTSQDPSGQHGRNGGLSVVVTGVDPRGRQTGGTGITVQLFSSSAPAVSGWRIALEVRISLEVAVGTVKVQCPVDPGPG